MSSGHVWTVEIVFTEDEDRTRADARLKTASDEISGWGRSRRSPADPDVPAVGEDLAASRALADLAHRLLHEAAHIIESYEGHAVSLSR